MIVTIDGGAGVGCSTVASRVAEKLGLPMLNRGSLFRAVAWEVLERGINPADESAVCNLLAALRIEFCEQSQIIAIGPVQMPAEEDRKRLLYSRRVTAAVPVVAEYLPVRRYVDSYLHRIAELQGGCVIEGRSTGTETFPNAPCKYFLVCEIAERVRRMQEGGRDETIETVEARDAADRAHKHGPFVKPDDATVIDTTEVSAIHVANEIVEHVQKTRLRLVA